MDLKIDKGMLKSLKVLAIVIGILGAIYVITYIWGIIGGTIFYVVTNGSNFRDTVVTGESFIADNTTTQQLSHYPITVGTLRVTNSSGTEFAISNFTVTYANASIKLKSNSLIPNATLMLANYTYRTTTINKLDVTADTETYLADTEDDFFQDLGRLRDAIGIAMSLLTLVIILLLFGGIFKGGKGKGKKSDGDMGY